ncbi:hypothetical protein [Treponema primitia]|uniref:hypothetical protein n=1 Tax=Treponema primitia TaxID=88058 RepID=UPI00025556BA|nr:hypothetical protein [Treponema primitia]
MFALYDKIKLFAPAVLLPLLIIAAGCAQDSIFDDISHEVPPTKPFIVGGPSKIIEAGGKLYVTNGRIFEYDLTGNGRWKRSTSGPGGKVQDLAADSGFLYALSIIGTGRNFQVWQKEKDGSEWTRLTAATEAEGYTVQSLFGTEDQLFMGASISNGGGNDYAILYKKGTELYFLEKTNGILSGAGKIDDVYYLGTLGSGIHMVKKDQLDPSIATPDVTAAVSVPMDAIPTRIAGFLQPTGADYIIAASRNGYILYGTKDGFTVPTTSLGGTFTGALALTPAYTYTGSSSEPVADTMLLLIGIDGRKSYSNHGYKEVAFNIYSGVVDGEYPKEPGIGDPTSIDKNGNYVSTLKKYPVTSMYALEHISEAEPNPIMFASTPKEGLYSYRYRSNGGGWQWNHEE